MMSNFEASTYSSSLGRKMVYSIFDWELPRPIPVRSVGFTALGALIVGVMSSVVYGVTRRS